ncbi:MAG TPA: DedA family protein [Roseobacter sp.]|uniref:VTT domain-containing protein n=1 Tax=marine sediment metagenome TaxID=412755 RepID=A0A0F9RP52_9ZZZZ|nr:DedA family protein [Roseobacter sp.]|tara:strand:- start:1207 stop:1851 length:645 start_codon:yes stop_codon:yes gene_type:complete
MLWIKDYLLTLVEQYGVIALFVSITLETLGLPVPGESALMVFAGAAGAGKISIWHVVLAAYVAAVLGDNIGYLIGRRYGRAVILRYGGKVGVTSEKYTKAEQVADKYGAFMVIAARFVVVLRQLNGLVAGSTGMHWARFLAANLIGAALWVGFWSTLAYQFGHSAAIVPFILQHLSVVAMIVVPTMIVLLFFVYRHMKREKYSEDDQPIDPNVD